MIILHVVESLSSSGGGLPAAVKALVDVQATDGLRPECFSTDDAIGSADVASLRKGPGLASSKAFRRIMALCVSLMKGEYDKVHLHGIWNIYFPLICIACRIGRIPYVVTTHGQMLSTILAADSYAKSAKKRLYYFLVGRWILTSAERIHVSSENERIEFTRKQSLSTKVIFIPHILDEIFLSCEDSVDTALSASRKDILFVGRLDPRKGIMELIDGFAKAGLSDEWHLRLVGPDGGLEFMDKLRLRLTADDVAGRVGLEPPVYGDERLMLYRSCYIFCLPSYSEAPGLVNIEAAISGRPVITTAHTGLFEISRHGGVLCETTADSIAATLREVSQWSRAEYMNRTERLTKWARSSYSLHSIKLQWRDFYGNA